jgi:hypothetical protein
VSGVEPVRYRLYRSMRDEQQTDTPRCVITATFDVDGPERQRHIVDRLVDAAAAIGSLPGALSSHFHISTDGTRVLNCVLVQPEPAAFQHRNAQPGALFISREEE